MLTGIVPEVAKKTEGTQQIKAAVGPTPTKCELLDLDDILGSNNNSSTVPNVDLSVEQKKEKEEVKLFEKLEIKKSNGKSPENNQSKKSGSPTSSFPFVAGKSTNSPPPSSLLDIELETGDNNQIEKKPDISILVKPTGDIKSAEDKKKYFDFINDQLNL